MNDKIYYFSDNRIAFSKVLKLYFIKANADCSKVSYKQSSHEGWYITVDYDHEPVNNEQTKFLVSTNKKDGGHISILVDREMSAEGQQGLVLDKTEENISIIQDMVKLIGGKAVIDGQKFSCRKPTLLLEMLNDDENDGEDKGYDIFKKFLSSLANIEPGFDNEYVERKNKKKIKGI